ncbi:MAG: DUF4835 domain-containing protein [Bacteroidetes bacterium CG_4_10_14_3_um_filter_31_20]|nr:MAG: DUF4835 domain-containing protein [Bacteroidetes bacterium CG_4_8_14_3_um_filter_31_14]PIY02746.1 MAG: DUF4835 domain-containing protein [Bacteroidetes bacterium CG_4_10_14_3_um_filter_31_20]
MSYINYYHNIMQKFIIICFLFISDLIVAQELNCRVQVVSQQIQGSNKHIFESMQKDIYEFLNNRKWTDNVFSNDERIECNLLINLTEQISADEYKGTIQVQSNRPVFSTNFNSVIFNFKDNDVQFRYVEFQSMEFSENTNMANLTSLLAYYVYIIIGLDYDSFSLNGGSAYFQKAEKIVTNAQSAQEKGWKSFESQRNRYWLIENILNPKYSPIREFFYLYHRNGLDIMAEKPSDGRTQIAESLKLLQKVYREKPSPFMTFLQVIFDAKSDEFVNVFSESYPDEKTRVNNLLKEIDPANSTKYQKIMLTDGK